MPLARHTLLLAAWFALAATEAAAQTGVGACVMGETRETTFGQNGLYGTGVTIYQWFDPATCGFCLVSGGAIQMRSIEIQAYTSRPAPALIVATATFLGWKGSASCPEPDESVVTLAPQEVQFTVPASAQQTHFTLEAPILGSPAYTQPGFVRLEFMTTQTIATDVAVGQIAAPNCTSCRQYVTMALNGAVKVDACSGGAIYPWVVRPRGDCVAPVETRLATWGRLKQFYH